MMHRLRYEKLSLPVRTGLVTAGLAAGLIAFLFEGSARSASLIWAVTLAVGGLPVAWQTIRGMLQGRFAADIVATMAMVGAALTQEWFAGAVIALMQTGGEALELYAVGKATRSLEGLLARAPRQARRRTNEILSVIPVEDVRTGDTVVMRAGDIVPVDAVVTAGTASVDESALTGEPMPVTKRVGDDLMSGSICLDAVLEASAVRSSEASQYEQVVRLVREAQTHKAPLARLADRYAVVFTPVTLAMCAAAYGLTGRLEAMVAVLVVATPCPLILATPVAIISGINRSARHGIIVKGGAAIEAAGRVRAAIFDKTGTLTVGRPVVDEVLPLDGFGPEPLLGLAGALEQLSSHPLAQAIVASVPSQARAKPSPTDVRENAGMGMEGIVDGRLVLVGSPRFALSRGLVGSDEIEAVLRRHGSKLDAPRAVIGVDGHVSGLVTFSDPIRTAASQLVVRLRGLGIVETVMITGDDEETARAIASECGVEDVRANLLPSQKAEAVREVEGRFGPAVMVGDGINDAPALATAAVGVALGARGAAVSAEAADIVITTDNLEKVADAIQISRRTMGIARQSIRVGLGVSGALMVAAAFGLIVPAVGALLQEALDVAVILNALRARSDA